MQLLTTRKKVLCVGLSVATAAGALMIVASAFSAWMHSGWVALAAFVVGSTVIAAAAVALLPAWRRTIPPGE